MTDNPQNQENVPETPDPQPESQTQIQPTIDPPLDEKGNPKLSFEVKIRRAGNDVLEKAIFIDGEILDWQVDITSLMDAMKMGKMYYRAVQRDIEKHFTESVSETIGRKVNAEDIKEAIKTGWI